MRLLVGLTLISMAVAFRWSSAEKDETELADGGKGDAVGRVAIAPPLTPVRNGVPLLNPGQIINPAAASILNPLNQLNGINGGTNLNVFFPPIRITVDPTSQLFVPPGTDGRILIQLRNDGVGDFFLISGGDDKNFFQQFDYSQVQLGPGQTIVVPGRIRVPVWANGVISTLNVIVQRRTDNAISQRRIFIRAKSESGERYAPYCTVRTVTRCEGYLDESICSQRYWNMRVELQDSGDSGLLSIDIKPEGRFLGEDFPVGTNQSVAIEQTVSCCTTGVDITAKDLRGNTVTCRADQYSIYLGSGDIAAIVLGVLLLIILLIVIVLLICRCLKRRRSVNTAPIPRKKKDQQ